MKPLIAVALSLVTIGIFYRMQKNVDKKPKCKNKRFRSKWGRQDFV
jgi:hypothetical protein